MGDLFLGPIYLPESDSWQYPDGTVVAHEVLPRQEAHNAVIATSALFGVGTVQPRTADAEWYDEKTQQWQHGLGATGCIIEHCDEPPISDANNYRNAYCERHSYIMIRVGWDRKGKWLVGIPAAEERRRRMHKENSPIKLRMLRLALRMFNFIFPEKRNESVCC